MLNVLITMLTECHRREKSYNICCVNKPTAKESPRRVTLTRY
jgi:hypothetical protein